MSETGTHYWRALGKPQLEHDGQCVFRREERAREYEAEAHREARHAPEGLVSVLRNEAAEDGLGDGPRRRSRPALSRWLLRLLEEAGLTSVLRRQPDEHQRVWVSKLRKVTGHFMVAPGRGLSQWWFPYPGEWHRKRVHARLRAAAGEWPRGYRPQAYLSRVTEVVEAHAVGEEGRESRVVVNRIGLPMVGRGMAG